jgi:hypothetical protein
MTTPALVAIANTALTCHFLGRRPPPTVVASKRGRMTTSGAVDQAHIPWLNNPPSFIVSHENPAVSPIELRSS